MKLILKNIKYLTICLLAVSFFGCEDDDVVNLPEVISGFTFTLNEETATVTFINISEEASSYEWDFGDGETSTLINPIKKYTESGTYTVTLEASNVAGASNVFEDEITIVILDQVTLPITFDNTTVDYSPTVFGGASFEIVANPDASGSNTSTGNVGAITNGGNAFEGLFFDLGTPIDLTTEKSITMNFWSETPVDVLLKLEEGTAGAIEFSASHGGTGWEAIEFDFTSSAQYSRLTLFVDGPGTAAGDFFIDDIAQAATAIADSGCSDTPVAATALPLDFEACATFASEFNFGSGISSELAPNPAKGGINDSNFVLKVDKPAGSDFFAGIQNTFANNFDLTTTNAFKLKIYSSKANTVFRFELALNPQTDPVTGNPAPIFVTVPNANEWTEVEVVFTGLPGGTTAYNQLVIKPDNNQTDGPITEGGTYYFDDIRLEAAGSDSGGDGGSLEVCDGGDLVNDFETADDSIFNNFGGGVGTIIDNPDTSVNSSAKLAQYVKNAGEVFGGITIALDSNLDLNNGTFNIDVKSQSVRQLLFKLEGLNQELIIATSGTGWETISYDFTGNAGEVTGITLIMDNGTQGDGNADWTIQFDNIRLCDNGSTGGSGGSLEVCDGGDLVNDFETADDSIFNNFGGGVGTIIDNPDTSVNSSAKLAQYVKNAGEVFGGITIALDSNIDLNNGTFTIDVNSQSVRQLLFKLEGLNQELTIATSGTGWETISYDFTGNAGEVTGITLIMDNGTQGDGSADWTIQFDNIRLCDNESTGGSGGSLEVCDGGDLVNDFETADDSIFNNFGGGVGTIIDNPDTSVNSSAKLGQYVKNAGEVFGGITIALDSNIDLNNGTFTIDVNSQSVRQLLFKLEGLNQELVIATSGTGWETISYDFTGNAGEVTGITLIMDNGTQGDGSADWTIQFDNIRLCDNESSGGSGGSLEVCDGGDLVNDFETADDSIFNNFGGGVGTIIDNPDTSVNSSAKLAQYVKNAGEVFGGITIALDSNIDLNNGTFTIDVNSQSVRQLLFKLEGLNQELTIATSGTGWETISYDFTGNAGEVTGITLIMDNGTQGDGSADWTIQFDNIRLCDNGGTSGGGGCTGTEVAATTLPLDFEGCETFLSDLNFGAGLSSALIANPSKTGINTSDFVLSVDKPTGSDFFAGIQNVFPQNFDLTTTNTFKIKVFSTKANVVFRFELLANPNDGSIGNPAPVFVTIANANEWTDVEFIFTGLPAGPTAYSQLVIKPDNDQSDSAITNGGTYYLDDLRLE